MILHNLNVFGFRKRCSLELSTLLVKSGKKTYVEKVNWNKEIHFDKKKNSNIG